MKKQLPIAITVGAIGLLAAPTKAEVPPLPPSQGLTCVAENARDNLTSDLKVGADYVPVTADDSLGFYVVYSVKPDEALTSGMFIVPLSGNNVVLYGAGYQDSRDGKASEAAQIDAVLQGCMGLSPATASLHFFAPHGHLDHINPELIDELQALGYSFAEIVYHEGDANLVDAMDWDEDDRLLFRELTGTLCGDRIEQFISPLGRVWFSPRAGHTPGAIDMLIDIEMENTNRALVRGSVEGGACTIAPGVTILLEAHGTAQLTPSEEVQRAEVEIMNAPVPNRLCLSAEAGPQIGSVWDVQMDATTNPTAAGFLLLGYSQPLIGGGLQFPFGSLLIDLGSVEYFRMIQPTILPSFRVDVPSDSAVLGLEAWVQGIVLGNVIELCNALHVTIGV